MNLLMILLLPFTLVYRGFITVILSPYYLVTYIIKSFKKNDNKTKAESKKSDKKITIKETKTNVLEKKNDINSNNNSTLEKTNTQNVYRANEIKKDDNKKIPKVKTDDYVSENSFSIPVDKNISSRKKQKLYDRYLKKARLEEKRRVKEIERIKKKNELKEKERLKKEKEIADEENQALKKEKLNTGSFGNKIKNLLKKMNTPINQQIDLETRKRILEEGFKEEIKKDSDLKPMLFTYVAKNKNGEIEKNEIEALTRADIHSFLVMEGYEVYDIFPSKTIFTGNIANTKLKRARLIFYLSQLSAYLKSGIALSEAIKYLYKQAKRKSERAVWRSVYYDLAMGDVLSVAMEKRKTAFPKLLINMIKTAEMTGNLAETLDDMVDYYSEVDQNMKQMKSAMTYPAAVLSFAFVVVLFILIWVVPQFKEIFKSMGSKPPTITQITLSVSDFLSGIGGIITIAIIGIIIAAMVFMYYNVRSFRKFIQEIAMHVPVFGNIIIYNEVNIFSKTFANLINHNVFITDSMGILSKITNNEIYKKLIFETANNLTKGEPVSKAFNNQWAFPVTAYQMLLTGEKTGRLGEMMEKVSNYYGEQHRNIINQMKTLIEPILIVGLAIVVGFILLSILIPLFASYNLISS